VGVLGVGLSICVFFFFFGKDDIIHCNHLESNS